MDNGKENLILVNGFYTNSLILKGFIEFLNDHFRVHFIDLPGFCLDAPPLGRVSFEGFAEHVRRRIEALGLDHYILGGLSFGFAIANSLPPDGRCRGIMAIVPYLDKKSLALSRTKRRSYRLVTSLAVRSGLGRRVWRTRGVRRFAHWYSKYPSERVDIILDQMDARTFFETGRLILKNGHRCAFHDLPYVLIVNPADGTVDFDYTVRRFRESVRRLLVVETAIDHYPDEISKGYFQTMFGAGDMDRVRGFIREGAAGRSGENGWSGT